MFGIQVVNVDCGDGLVVKVDADTEITPELIEEARARFFEPRTRYEQFENWMRVRLGFEPKPPRLKKIETVDFVEHMMEKALEEWEAQPQAMREWHCQRYIKRFPNKTTEGICPGSKQSCTSGCWEMLGDDEVVHERQL